MGRNTPAKDGYFCLMRRSNGYYYYWVYDNFNHRIYRSTGQRTKAKAMDVAIRRLQDGALIDVPKPIYHKLGDYAAHFWDWDTCPVIQDKIRRGGHYSREGAQSNARLTHKHIIRYFKDVLIEAITARMVEQWILRLPAEHQLSNKSCNNVLTIFRQILDEAVIDGIVETNVAKKVKPLIKDGKRRGCFTMEQIKQLFASPWEAQHMYAACYLAAMTGMRQGEVLALVPEQIHRDYIDVNASWARNEGRKCTKSGYGRVVPIDAKTYHLLEQIMPPGKKDLIFTLDGVQPISCKTVLKYLYEKMDELGIDYKAERLGFHSFRHFVNTRLVAAGVSGEKVRAVIGHEDAEMTEHYLHLSQEDMEQIRAVQRGIAM